MDEPPLEVSASAASVDSGDRVAVLDLARPGDPPMILTGTAAEIWRRLDGTAGLEGVVALLADQVGLDPATIAPDVAAFVADLRGRGLVTGG